MVVDKVQYNLIFEDPEQCVSEHPDNNLVWNIQLLSQVRWFVLFLDGFVLKLIIELLKDIHSLCYCMSALLSSWIYIHNNYVPMLACRLVNWL